MLDLPASRHHHAAMALALARDTLRIRIRDLIAGRTVFEGTPREAKAYWVKHNRLGHDDWRPQIWDARRARVGGFHDYGWRDLIGAEIRKWRELEV